jgi:hypothetical protein
MATVTASRTRGGGSGRLSGRVTAAGRSPRRVAGILAVVAAVAVTIVIAARAVRHGWTPSSDWALIELRVRDVGTRNTPLVGAFSRYGWNHPGPLLFYALALPYRLSGARSSALLVGALLINVGAIAVVLYALRRAGNVALAVWGASLVAVLCHALGTSFLVDPWNPHASLLAFFAFVALAFAAASGVTWALPAAVFAGSFAAQSDVGYLVEIAVLGAFATVMWWRSKPAHRKRVAIGSAVLAFVLWFPPMLQQVVTRGGNLKELYVYATSHHATVGLGTGWRIVAQQLTPWPPWVSGHELVSPFTRGLVLPSAAAFPVALLVLAAAGVWAGFRHDAPAVRLCAFAAIAVVFGIYDAAQARAPVYDYLVQWMWVVGALCWLAAGWALWRGVAARLPQWTSPAAGFVLVGSTAALVVGLVISGWNPALPTSATSVAVGRITPAALQAARAAGHGHGPVYVAGSLGFTGQWVAWGLELQLERHGLTTLAPRSLSDLVGVNRAQGSASASTVLQVAADDDIAKMRAQPGTTLLTEYDSLVDSPDPQSRERARLTSEIEALQAKGEPNSSPDVITLYNQLQHLPSPPGRVHVALFELMR